MDEIEMHQASSEFARCWRAAGRALQRHLPAQSSGWLKASLSPPFLEHLSFQLGNQLFFVRIEDVNGELEVPGSRRGLRTIARGCDGHACILPMRRLGDLWHPAHAGWSLLDAHTQRAVVPPTLVTSQPIEMTDWEVHDLAVSVVRDRLVEQGRELMSAHGDPDVDPSLWFVGDNGPEWVLVRASRYPDDQPAPPANLGEIAAFCRRMSQWPTTGHLATMIVASSDQLFEPQAPAVPLWRGQPLQVFGGELAAIESHTLEVGPGESA